MVRAWLCHFKGMNGVFIPTEDFQTLVEQHQHFENVIAEAQGRKPEPKLKAVNMTKEVATA